MQHFLSCDWGTSFLRLRLADAISFAIIAGENSPQGIKSVFALWREQALQDDELARTSFYLQFIHDLIRKIETKLGVSLNGAPIIVSGMASSSIGMKELPYRQLPFATDGSDAITQYTEAGADLDHPVLLISGIRTNDDVMRGEETQLVGCMTYMQETEGKRLFIFPGTHSKHIIVNDKQVTGFKTYMTGEFFELLSQKSILHTGLETHHDMQDPEHKKAFRQGVNDALHANLLQATFRARTNSLFNTLSKKENYSYLSGLLISTELQDIDSKGFRELCICAGGKLGAYYELASETLGLHNIRILPEAWVEQSAIRGQMKIFNQSFIKK